MADCSDCMWWNTIDHACLLGRNAAGCDNRPARRGDLELVERILNLPEDQREMLARRFEPGPADEDGASE